MSAFEFMPQFGLSIMLGCLVMDVSVIRKESDIPVITIALVSEEEISISFGDSMSNPSLHSSR